MLRRSHKKSRTGCLQCKRRHVKCDERRPACLMCSMSDRECSFAAATRSEHVHTLRTSHSSSTSPVTPQLHPPTGVSPPFFDTATLPEINISEGSDADLGEAALNLNHMELVIHLLHDKEIFNLGLGDGSPSKLARGLKIGLGSPYLLHQLLAFSACRLAYLHPERSAFYHHQAVTLQTRAVSLFNATWNRVDRSNCVPVLIFSTVLGHHLLADTLRKREPGGIDAFLAHYIQSLDVQRGIYTVAKSAWPLLMESELAPILSVSSSFTSRSPKGAHCERVRGLVESSNVLCEQDKEGCRVAIQYLQIGFDAWSDNEEQLAHHMIFTWTMLTPREFTALLASKRPEALAIWAYYALLLHYGRDMWQVRDAGDYIMGMIRDFLGAEWDPWVAYPLEIIAKERKADL